VKNYFCRYCEDWFWCILKEFPSFEVLIAIYILSLLTLRKWQNFFLFRVFDFLFSFFFVSLLITYAVKQYTECPRRNVLDFGRVFLMLKYTDITQNTYVQS
jgi:hypothetical protein